tara:strand:- start:11914 stop:12078 length:165 start_codon:yes stop_codon:yes gene_type:complete
MSDVKGIGKRAGFSVENEMQASREIEKEKEKTASPRLRQGSNLMPKKKKRKKRK